MSASWRLHQYSRRLCGKIPKSGPAHHGTRTRNLWYERPTLYLCTTVLNVDRCWCFLKPVWCPDLQPVRTERVIRRWLHWIPCYFTLAKWCPWLFLFLDDALGLRTYLIKPYSGRHLTREEIIVNYRKSRARPWVQLSTMQQMPVTIETIVEACVFLHNFIRLRNRASKNIQLDAEYYAHNLIPGAWRQDVNLPGFDFDVPQRGNRDTCVMAGHFLCLIIILCFLVFPDHLI